MQVRVLQLLKPQPQGEFKIGFLFLFYESQFIRRVFWCHQHGLIARGSPSLVARPGAGDWQARSRNCRWCRQPHMEVSLQSFAGFGWLPVVSAC